MAYKIIPGVKHDAARNAYYQLARYPNGKIIEVPVRLDQMGAPLRRFTIDHTWLCKPGGDATREESWLAEVCKEGRGCSVCRPGETINQGDDDAEEASNTSTNV